MKRIAIIMVLALLLVSVAVSATETTLSEDDLTMELVDSETVEFCLYEGGVPQDVTVVIDPVCRDLNEFIGCNAGDEYDPAGFTAVPVDGTTGPDGCVDIVLTTMLDPEDAGKFYYTVNGQVGGTTVGSETGTVQVPEFGIIAAALVLGLAGFYIYKKRD